MNEMRLMLELQYLYPFIKTSGREIRTAPVHISTAINAAIEGMARRILESDDNELLTSLRQKYPRATSADIAQQRALFTRYLRSTGKQRAEAHEALDRFFETLRRKYER